MFSSGKQLSKSLYILGVSVILLTVYAPYFVSLGPIGGYLVVYGAPILVVSLLFGRQIVSKMTKNNKEAFKLTMGSFSLFYVAGVFLAAIAFAIIMQFDSSAQHLIEQPNPALDVSPTVALVMMGVAMLVVGPAEEYLFRGFLFGGLLSIFKGKHWFVLGIVSSLIFSLAHGYYAITYGVVSPIFYIQLTLFGMAMCLAYYWSGGNLVALAVIHGLSDAIGFLGVATTRTVGLTAQGIFLAVGLVFGVFYVLLKKVRINPTRISGEPQPQLEQRAH